MRSVFDVQERAHLQRRIDGLQPNASRRWGQMSAHQAVCHLTDAVESAFKPAPTVSASGPLTWRPIRWLILNVLPWPKGKLQSPPDLLQTQPTDWRADIERLKVGLERVGSRGPDGEWPASDVFGELTGRHWGALLWTHLDHHLKQFGV